MNKKQLEKWGSIRLNGKKSYVIKHGVLLWGIQTSILWSIIMHIVDPQKNLWIRPIIALMLFPIGGVFFGLFMWKYSEKRYHDALAEAHDQAQLR